MDQKTPTLPEYIATVGDEPFAKLLNVSVRTSANWRLKIRMPSGKKAAEIVAKTNGRVSISGIFGAHVKPIVFMRGRPIKEQPVIVI